VGKIQIIGNCTNKSKLHSWQNYKQIKFCCTIQIRAVIFFTENSSVPFQVEQLQENCQRLNQQNSELEQLFKDALTENRKLQDSIDTLKLNSDKQHQELQVKKTIFLFGSYNHAA